MARENKSRYVVLGLLAHKSMSGYDIKKLIEKSLGYFWCESNGQLYPILKELEKDGLATKSILHQDKKPDRHIYTITQKGRKQLQDWLHKPSDPGRYKLESMLKIFFGNEAGISCSLKNIHRIRERQRALYNELDEIGKYIQVEHSSDPSLPYWMLTLKCGMRLSSAMIEWCDESEAELQAFTPTERNNDDKCSD